MRVAVLVSGGGTNLQALLDEKAQGKLPGIDFCVVISSLKTAYALERAKQAGIPTRVVRRKDYLDAADFDRALALTLEAFAPDYVILAGYLAKIGPEVLKRWPERILNIHPALLPLHGGEGMYGIKPHEAVLANKEEWTGATVHVIDGDYDRGRILCQKKVKVEPGDTAEVLQKRVMEEAEWVIYAEVLRDLQRAFENGGDDEKSITECV